MSYLLSLEQKQGGRRWYTTGLRKDLRTRKPKDQKVNTIAYKYREKQGAEYEPRKTV